jgi:hypothetical protein
MTNANQVGRLYTCGRMFSEYQFALGVAAPKIRVEALKLVAITRQNDLALGSMRTFQLVFSASHNTLNGYYYFVEKGS